MGKKGKRSHSESFAATHGQPSMANTSDSAKKRLKQEKRKQVRTVLGPIVKY